MRVKKFNGEIDKLITIEGQKKIEMIHFHWLKP